MVERISGESFINTRLPPSSADAVACFNRATYNPVFVFGLYTVEDYSVSISKDSILLGS
jgi:hypothetical protein